MNYTKKSMKKIFTIMLVGVCIISLLCGCGTTKVETGNSDKVTITIGGWPTKEGATLDNMNATLARFNEVYGDEIEIIPDTWTFSVDTFLPKAASGQLPTLYGAYFTEAKRIIDSGYAADITAQMEKYGYSDKINESIIDMVKKDDKFYMVPVSSYAMGMLGNMNILREAGLVDENDNPIFPKTYKELREYSKIIKDKTGKAGFIMPTTGNNGGWHFTIIAWANGVDFMEKDQDGKWKATFNTPECVEVLQWIKDMKWEDNSLNANILVDMAEAQKIFATDQGAFYLSSTPSNTLITNYGMNKDDIAMGSIPAGEKEHVTLMGGNVKIIAPNATEEQKEAVFKWLEFVGDTPELTENVKVSQESTYKTNNEENYVVGVPKFSPWNDNAPVKQFLEDLNQKYLNVPVGHIEQYSNFDGIKVKPEEPVCVQELYGALDACIQAVLSDKNADCAKIIADAARDFQANFLDSAK